MDKLLLLTPLLAVVVVPLFTADDPEPRRGLRRTLIALAIINAVYLVALYTIWPRLMDG